MIFIILNMIQMGVQYEGQPPYMEFILRTTNYIFTLVFLLECILKLIAYGKSYFDTSWNKFDFFVVLASLVDLSLELLEFIDSPLSGLPIGNIAKVMRVLRVSRIIRLASKS